MASEETKAPTEDPTGYTGSSTFPDADLARAFLRIYAQRDAASRAALAALPGIRLKWRDVRDDGPRTMIRELVAEFELLPPEVIWRQWVEGEETPDGRRLIHVRAEQHGAVDCESVSPPASVGGDHG